MVATQVPLCVCVKVCVRGWDLVWLDVTVDWESDDVGPV